MLIRHAKLFNLGMLLALSFLGVLFLIFQPLFDGKNGLEFSDDLFNKLSKGSSYFIPDVLKGSEKFVGTNFTVNIKLDKPEQVEGAVKLLSANGAQAVEKDTQLAISGDLGKLLGGILKDSEEMYQNDGSKVAARYGSKEMDVMALWWSMLSKMNKEFQKEKKVTESDMVMKVMQKAVEPAYNYYGVQPEKVSGKAFTVIGLLVFYVIYTMWWGYAIFYLFDGIGLTMKKAKVKKEV
jgi:hypothetical protein